MYSGRSFATIAAHVSLTMTLTVILAKPKRWPHFDISTVVAKTHSVMATLHSVDTLCLRWVFCYLMIGLSCWQRYWNVSWLNLKLSIQSHCSKVFKTTSSHYREDVGRIQTLLGSARTKNSLANILITATIVNTSANFLRDLILLTFATLLREIPLRLCVCSKQRRKSWTCVCRSAILPKTTPAFMPNYGCGYNNWWSSEIEWDLVVWMHP